MVTPLALDEREGGVGDRLRAEHDPPAGGQDAEHAG